MKKLKNDVKKLKRNNLYQKELYLKILHEYKTIHKEYYLNKLLLEKNFHTLKYRFFAPG